MTKPGDQKPVPIPSVQLSAREWEECIKQLDADTKPERRNETRISPTRRFNLVMAVMNNGSVGAQWLVQPRDVSAHGIGFFHRGFLYNGTKLQFQGTSLDGEDLAFEGVVTRCRFLRGNVHDVGVKLSSSIPLSAFIPGFDDEAATGVNPSKPAGVHARIAELAHQLAELAKKREDPARLAEVLGEIRNSLGDGDPSAASESLPPPAAA
jgi:hypothetical protein